LKTVNNWLLPTNYPSYIPKQVAIDLLLKVDRNIKEVEKKSNEGIDFAEAV